MTCFFFIVTDTCDENIVLQHERNVTQWSDCQLSFLFEQSNTPLGHVLVVIIFAKKEKGYIYPYFAIHLIQFSNTVKTVRNEST